MVDPLASPGDPMFYMHHGFLDRLWAKWQNADHKRLNEVNGNNHVNLTYPWALGHTVVFEGLNFTFSPKVVPPLNDTNAAWVLGEIFNAQRPADVP